MPVPAPVAYWKFDESSGNAVDATGNGYDLTNNNTVGFTTGALNNCADFGASNTNKTFTTTATLGIDNNADRTLAGWVNLSTAAGSGEIYGIVAMGYTSNRVFYAMEYREEGGIRKLWAGRGRDGIDDPTIRHTITFTPGVWYHLGLTYNGTTRVQELFINGSSVGSNTAAAGNGIGGVTDITTFARAPWGAARFLKGLTDEWGVWNSILSSSDIAELYNGGTPLAYPFSGGGGPPTASSRLTMMGIT